MVTRSGRDGTATGEADDTRRRPLLATDTWSRVGEVIETAITIPDAAARAAFVDTSCSGDPALLAEVRSLLAADAHADLVLPATRWLDATALADDAAVAKADLQAHWIGRRVGAWRIVQWLASGGMGYVYRAHRDDAAYEQTVAVKLLRARGAASTQWFREERQLLASLSHPGIARLIDGGAADDGTLYLVMELVEGEAIDHWCMRSKPPPAEWLARFLDVCAAVQYAHQRLIVHRDIKPANVMVTHDGGVKLLDFGIAQITDRVGGVAAGDGAAVALTPGWASPEQLRGETVTTASDVHALGALLLRLADGGAPGASRAKVAGDDLHSIGRKAMAAEPSQRYASAAQLSDDVRRYLAREPVQARAGGVAYRTGRFVQRHAGGVALAALALLGVLVAGSIAIYQAQLARAAEREAGAQRIRAEQHFSSVRKMTNQLLFDLHRKLAAVPGTTRLQKELIGQSLAYLDGLRADAAGDAALLHEVGAGYRRLGRILGGVQGANTGERGASEQAYEKAAAALDAALAIQPQTATAVEQLKTLTEFAEQQGLYRNFPRSSALFARAAALAGEATMRAPDDADLFYSVQKVIVARNVSALYLGNGSFDGVGMEQSAQALVARQSAYPPASDDAQAIRAILWRCYTALAEASRRSGGIDGAGKAVRWHLRGVELMRSNEQLHPSDVGYRRSTLNARVELADAYAAADEPGAAIAEMRAILGDFEALYQTDPANEDAALDVLKATASLADYHRRAGDVAQTSAMVERAQQAYAALAAGPREHFVAQQSRLKLLLAQAWLAAHRATLARAGSGVGSEACARATQNVVTARKMLAADPALADGDLVPAVDAMLRPCRESKARAR